VPTILTHAIVGATVARASSGTSTWRLTAAAAICAALPDLDVVAFRFGIPYGSMLGHRGVTHSLIGAGAIAAAALALTDRGTKSGWTSWVVLFAATASHGLLDALTDGGLGVAFFAPFSSARYFFPWRPILVSPIGAQFFSARGVTVLASEVVWVWIPAAVVLALGQLLRPRGLADAR
jgi:inner membrane protein